MTRRQYLFLIFLTVASGFLGGAASGWLLNQPALAQGREAGPTTVSELRLVDESGRTRGLLSLFRGRPRFILLGEAGEFQVELGFDQESSPGLRLRDPDGKPRVRLALSAAGSPDLTFMDRNGFDRTSLGLSTEGAPALKMSDEAGKGRVALWQDKSQLGLALADGQGLPRAHLALAEGAAPSLAFYDAAQKPIWFVPER
ncbi:MAG: hypothetical protein V1816_10705 [Pseudomonadota bacterium]